MEIYYTTTKILRREEMLEKINSKYKSNVTLDSVLSNIGVMNKTKIPFIILNILAFVIQEIRDIWYGVTVNPQNDFSIPWLVLMGFLYLIESIGFLIWGRRMVNILPQLMVKKLQRITRIIIVISLIFFLSYVYAGLAFIFVVHDAYTFIAADAVWRFMLLVIVIFVLSLFIKPSSTWPLCFQRGHSRNTSNNSAGSPPVSTVIGVELADDQKIEVLESSKGIEEASEKSNNKSEQSDSEDDEEEKDKKSSNSSED